MDDGDNFFVYLPSNVNTGGRYDETNNSSHYMVPLSQPLALDDSWEVGLSEIFFPNYSYNITHPMNHSIHISYPDPTNRNKRISGVITIDQGAYTPLTFVKILSYELKSIRINNEEESRSAFRGRFKYDKQRQKIEFTLGPKERITFTDPLLRKMIGFRPDDPDFIENPTDEVRSAFMHERANFCVNGNHMFVYASIVNPSRIGNHVAPLLRVVSLNMKEHEDGIHREYKNAHYFRLPNSYIQEIEIKLCNTEGNYMQFIRGDSLLVLNFRKRYKSKFDSLDKFLGSMVTMMRPGTKREGSMVTRAPPGKKRRMK